MMINNVSRHLTSRQPVKGNFGKKTSFCSINSISLMISFRTLNTSVLSIAPR